MQKNDFDPLAYIESAFLDNRKDKKTLDISNPDLVIPTMRDYLEDKDPNENKPIEGAKLSSAKGRFKKTQMSAPRPRRAGGGEAMMDPRLDQVWRHLPKSVAFLTTHFDDSVTANYYGTGFTESRVDLITRLLDPEINLEEAARLLGVCPATIRRYTNRGWLHHHRTKGGQRRFRLSDIVNFVDQHGRFPHE